MPRVRSLRRTSITVLAVALLMVVIAAPVGAAPRTTASWGTTSCTDLGGQVDLVVTGKGRWAYVEVEYSTDGATFTPLQIRRVEQGVTTVWSVALDETWFRARPVRKNGTPLSGWSTTFVDCTA